MLEHTLVAKKFYNSRKWKNTRKAYISTVLGGLCEHCDNAVGYIVDHIIEINSDNINDAEITLNHDNLQYLCLPCHNTKTFRGKTVADGCYFTADGQLKFNEKLVKE